MNKVQPFDIYMSERVKRTEDGCLIWQGAKHEQGYGRVYWNNTQQFAHRAWYQHTVRALEKGEVLDHLCRHRACVEPTHLEAVTRSENVRRRWSDNEGQYKRIDPLACKACGHEDAERVLDILRTALA